MQGIVLAAGLGTRLAPYTHQVPKALFRVGNKTLLDWVLQKMLGCGISPVVINLFYFSSMVRQHVMSRYSDAGVLFSDEGLSILGTGGGIVQAARFLSDGDDVLVHNVDVLSGIDLVELRKAWQDASCDVLLVVKERHSSRELLFEPDTLRWVGWRGKGDALNVVKTDSSQAFGFCGISIFKTNILRSIEAGTNFSFVKLLEMLHHQGCVIKAHITDEWWVDAGSLSNISSVYSYIQNFAYEISE